MKPHRIAAALIPPAKCLSFAVLVASSAGCMTTLGYVPEYPKAKTSWYRTADFATRVEYDTMRKWATDVIDGYGTRATLNAQADYGAALLAGIGVASLLGVTAFDGDKSWIKGIPIGTAFLASVFGIYNNEAKAQTYTLGGNYLQRLLNNSERRMQWRKDTKQAVIQEAINAVSKEQDTVNVDIKELKALIKKSVNDAPNNELTKKLTEDMAQLTEKLKLLELRRELAAQRLLGLQKLTSETCDKTIPPVEDADPKTKGKQSYTCKETRPDSSGTNAAKLPASDQAANVAQVALPVKGTNPGTSEPSDESKPAPTADEMREAFCLRDDVMDVMARVDRLNLTFLPGDVPEALRSIGVATKDGEATTNKAGDWVSAKLPDGVKEDLALFSSPIVSRCGVL